MSVAQALVAYIIAATVLTITPGPDSGLVLRTAIVDGAKQAARASLGIVTGLSVWGVAVAVGLGALMAASEAAFRILQWAGAIYLVWFGLRLMVKPRKHLDETPALAQTQAFRSGLLQNLLNPKICVFYVSFLPQFVPAGGEVLIWTPILASVHIGLTLIWFAALVLATRPLADMLRKPNVLSRIDRFTGAVFMASGAQLGLSRL